MQCKSTRIGFLTNCQSKLGKNANSRTTMREVQVTKNLQTLQGEDASYVRCALWNKVRRRHFVLFFVNSPFSRTYILPNQISSCVTGNTSGGLPGGGGGWPERWGVLLLEDNVSDSSAELSPSASAFAASTEFATLSAFTFTWRRQVLSKG